jgi:hypothetical protein
LEFCPSKERIKQPARILSKLLREPGTGQKGKQFAGGREEHFGRAKVPTQPRSTETKVPVKQLDDYDSSSHCKDGANWQMQGIRSSKGIFFLTAVALHALNGVADFKGHLFQGFMPTSI